MKDQRRELKELAKALRTSEYYGMGGQGAGLADAVLAFLKDERVTLVIGQDEYGVTCTAHPSPGAARRETISCMLDVIDDVWREEDDETRLKFLRLVSEGHFNAAAAVWNEQAREDGVDGVYFDTHKGKVEKNYSGEALSGRAASIMEDAAAKGVFSAKTGSEPYVTLRERVHKALTSGPKGPMEIAINVYGGKEKLFRSPKNADRPPRVTCAEHGGYDRISHMLWLMVRAGTVERVKKGLYQLK